MDLSPVEARVIGSLAEKQLTTPQQYPLTINALVLACNQSSNRDPVVAYEEGTLEPALSSLREAGLLRLVHPSHGRSATRYRQVLDERLGLDPRGLSILTILLLRGPQTVGELRTRTERMADFDSLEDVAKELGRLAEGDEPMVGRLPRRPGQKEDRWAHTLSGASPEPSVPAEPARVPSQGLQDPLGAEVALLRTDLDTLREEVSRIGAAVAELLTALGLPAEV
jgi:uncharacterized protein YceH (UPF0502 family)